MRLLSLSPFGSGLFLLDSFYTALASPLDGPLGERQQGCNADNLLRALENPTRTATASPFCSSYICASSTSGGASAVTVAVTTEAHPMYLYNLQLYASSETPLTYASPPSPSMVPGNPGCYDYYEGLPCPLTQKKRSLETSPPVLRDRQVCATPALPSFIATTYPPERISSACSCLLYSISATTTATPTTTCTSYVGASPETTVPAFCQPSFYINAPSFLAARSTLPTASATLSSVANKLDCCASCAGVFNCIAWSFLPSATETPSTRLPGGFDPWASGDCAVVYHVGTPGNPDGSVTTGDAGTVCPNGKVHEVLAGSNNVGEDTYMWSNLYYNGWNEGSCGAPLNDMESSQDGGEGDWETTCSS